MSAERPGPESTPEYEHVVLLKGHVASLEKPGLSIAWRDGKAYAPWTPHFLLDGIEIEPTESGWQELKEKMAITLGGKWQDWIGPEVNIVMHWNKANRSLLTDDASPELMLPISEDDLIRLQLDRFDGEDSILIPMLM